MIRRALFLLLVLSLLAPVTADAAVTRRKAIWGPTEADGESLFPTYKQLGAGIYQMTLAWDEVAVLEPLEADDPLDASYEWPDQIDTAISEARQNGIEVALTVTGKPEWARGPQPDDYADFLTAAAKRYPAIHLWVIWENPAKTFSARRYGRLLDAGYAALKARSRRNRVVGGNSTGNAARWIRGLGRARMDLYGHATTRALNAKAVDDLAEDAGKRLFLTLSLSANSSQSARLRSALRVARRESSVFSLGYRSYQDEGTGTNTGLVDVQGERRAAYNVFRRG
jgi:hypothetical protein